MKRTLLSALVILVWASQLYAQKTWTIDKSHTNIKFTAIHMLVAEVDGKFNEFDGQVVSPSADKFEGSEVTFTAKVASIDTDNERRDGHLKSDDFFNAEKFPNLTFSGKIVKEGDKHYLDGTLTIRDVTKPVKFAVKYNGQVDTGRGVKAGFKVTGSINRFDYNLKWDRTIEAGGLVVSEEIGITCQIELNQVATE